MCNVKQKVIVMKFNLTRGPFMQNGWKWREKFKSMRVVLQKMVTCV
jgi:hypothetical protein